MTQKAENFSKDQSKRKNDQDWIQKKLTEGKFKQVRDISQSTKPSPLSLTKDSLPLSPTTDSSASPLSPKRLESPVVLEDFGRGKRSKIQRTPCQNAGCSNDDCLETSNYHSHVQVPTSPVRRALFFADSDNEEVVPDDGDPNYEVVTEDEDESIPKPKIPRQTFERVIALQERFNRSDTEAALWWNMVSL